MFRLPRAAAMGGAMARAAARSPDRGPRRIRSAQRPAQQCPPAHTSWYSSLASSGLAVISEYSVTSFRADGRRPAVGKSRNDVRKNYYLSNVERILRLHCDEIIAVNA